jgi:radical SAM superfamily enzyme YgiQ (UPF0313 family)
MPATSVLLLIPPLTQLNTAYPSTAYLTGFLRERNIACEQADLGIEMVLRLFSPAGLRAVFDEIRKHPALHPEARRMLKAEDSYLETIEPVVTFLQGRDTALAGRLARPGVLPQGPRFRGRNRFSGSVSVQDRAKQWATFYLEDLADLVQAAVSPHFALSRYAEHIARSASSFDTILTALAKAPSLTDDYMLAALRAHLDRVKPELVGLSVPFPGNLYGAFRMAQTIKRERPDIRIALGGGYVNTELRRVSDPRVFDYVDFITLDDGERPLLSLVEHLAGTRSLDALCRTFYRAGKHVRFAHDPTAKNFSMGEVGCPTYRGLDLHRYLTILDSTNPMHRLWSEGHWNKLTVAHGCYWKHCTFCDVGLDYIGRYEATPTDHLIRRIGQLLEETGTPAFHFVDEAAPPAALKALALRLLEQGIKIRWWGNIRFEAAFSPDLCRLLAASGCIAVTAGLEAASDRLLEKMKKGITVDRTALVAAAFQDAGILIHAYLMYGFPSETIQETVDSLERVRQLFAAGLLQSAFWHRFTATAHSPIGLHPNVHGIRLLGPEFHGFAENDLRHADPIGPTPDWLGEGLRRSMLNFLEGRGLSLDVREWFDRRVPRPQVAAHWVRTLLKQRTLPDDTAKERRLVWLGERPAYETAGYYGKLLSAKRKKPIAVRLPKKEAEWLYDAILHAEPTYGRSDRYPRLQQVAASFPGGAAGFEAFLGSPSWKRIRRAGLLLV